MRSSFALVGEKRKSILRPSGQEVGLIFFSLIHLLSVVDCQKEKTGAWDEGATAGGVRGKGGSRLDGG